MPLTLEDMEKITTTLKPIMDRIKEGEDRTHEHIQRIESMLIPRVEYEKSHNSLSLRVTNLEQNMMSFAKFSMEEHEKINARIDANEEKAVNQERDNAKQFKQTVISFFIGGGLVGIIAIVVTIYMYMHPLVIK